MTQKIIKVGKAIKDERAYYKARDANVPRGTARAKRRYTGNYTPVNPEASVEQHPQGRYASSK